ncbi:pilus assembly protein [Solemya velesiana gill symbiont]|uniref:Uncharacterized protein n=1 Tax=Solemya velesiana gill symbiont TaxID=1918948 RepID=A0A1T2KSF7_9GAMM|nr:PilC/PilY family type IV pilus protein [Solemya velesiana gill symbiont]OOZ35626.1 hypothetical protein BOW51_11155 [Solemya velesiana gill symbiont]
MNIKVREIMKKCGIVVCAALYIATPAFADDVEIFFNTSNVSGEDIGDPLVMFGLDYRPNVINANLCNAATLAEVQNCGWDDPTTTDDDDFYAAYYNVFTNEDVADGSLSFLEVLRASLRYVLGELDDVRIGLMLNHAQINNCEGASGTAGCSNGGYIAMGLLPIDAVDNSGGWYTTWLDNDGDGVHDVDAGDDPSTGLNILDGKLASILDLGTGAGAHSNQGKELYFELYRYLRGWDIYNGHVGYADYDDRCDEDNLDDDTMPSCFDRRGNPEDDDDYPAIAWDATTVGDVGIGATAPDYPVEEAGNTEYYSPFEDQSLICSGVYAINFMFGVSNQDNDSDNEIEDDDAGQISAESAGMVELDGSDPIDISGNRNEFGTLIEWLYEGSDGSPRDLSDLAGVQNVTSYFMYKGNVQNTMNGYAVSGGSGQAYEVLDDPKAMVDTITNIFKEILRQNTTFEAPAVTVNSYNRLTHRDELFFALFSQEEHQNWPGNLKKYKLGEITTEVCTDLNGDGDTTDPGECVTEPVQRLVDQNDNEAVNQSDGVFKATTCSFWSNCSIDRDNDGTADADGDIVEWGGAAEEITLSRTLYTYIGTDRYAVHEDTSQITHEMLNVSLDETSVHAGDDICDVDGDSDGDFECVDMDGDGDADSTDHDLLREDLLQIARSYDPETGEVLQNMGDPIHARPAVIEYDADLSNQGACPDLRIAMTTNEGQFHLIDAGGDSGCTDNDANVGGTEVVSFMPEELLPQLKQVNGPITVEGTGQTRFNTYGLDGSPVVWRYDADAGDGTARDGVINYGADSDEDFVYLFLTQRRGGKGIWALDITNPTSPELMWKVWDGDLTSVNGTSAADVYSELGQTWSTPKLTKIKDGEYDRGVLVFGGGYDPDQDDAYSFSDTQGRAIYVVDAYTGEPLWTVSGEAASTTPTQPSGGASGTMLIPEMDNSIPAEVQPADIDSDGYLDRIYAVDVVGRVFRIDFDILPNGDSTSTQMYGGGMVAALNDSSCDEEAPTDGVADACHRRFYNKPDVAVMVGYPAAPYVQVAVGSGYRAWPASVSGIQDRFYVLFDENVIDPLLSSVYGTGAGEQYHWTEDSDLANLTDIPGDVSDYSGAQTAAETALGNKHGWYFNLELTTDAGGTVTSHEKVLSDSVTFNGLILFTTYIRSSEDEANVCEPSLGSGRFYAVNAFNGLPVGDINQGVFFTEDTARSDFSEADRYMNLGRKGIPTTPQIILTDEGPRVIVTTELIPEGLLDSDLFSKKWWLDAK